MSQKEVQERLQKKTEDVMDGCTLPKAPPTITHTSNIDDTTGQPTEVERQSSDPTSNVASTMTVDAVSSNSKCVHHQFSARVLTLDV